jgi:hypothetical protein
MEELKLRSEDLQWREIDGEVIALEKRDSAYLGTNASGTLLWRALVDGAREHELAALLVDAYGIGVEAARADAARFLADVRRQGLLRQ